MSNPRILRRWLLGACCFVLVLAGNLVAVHFLANDYDDDGTYYELLAQNIVEHHAFSSQPGPPYQPTAIRMPGYPLFLAGIYELCGVNHLWPVRAVQAFVQTVTAVLLSVLAALWEPRAARRRWAAGVAFTLAVFCPFTLIYAACILTETLTMFLLVAMILCATLAWSRQGRAAALWWVAAGGCGGLTVLLRPDAGLFAAAVGLTLVGGGLRQVVEEISPGLRRWRDGWCALRGGLRVAVRWGLLFSAGFVVAVCPWVVRNAAVFHRLQLLPPLDFSEPGVFSPVGYCAWFGTWSDDENDLPTLYWTLGPDQPMNFADVPPRAFDNADEQKRVRALFAEYNRHQPPVMMTPAIDARFAQLARERLARNPLRSALWLPLRRAVNLWFCTHSQYYDCEGHLFPLNQPDEDGSYQFGWLLFFAVATGLYTVLGIAGAGVLWQAGGAGRRWVCLLVLLVGLRLALLVRLEHTEPRYVVEFFPFLCVLGGVAAGQLAGWKWGAFPPNWLRRRRGIAHNE
jgi:hypothetical protein